MESLSVSAPTLGNRHPRGFSLFACNLELPFHCKLGLEGVLLLVNFNWIALGIDGGLLNPVCPVKE